MVPNVMDKQMKLFIQAVMQAVAVVSDWTCSLKVENLLKMPWKGWDVSWSASLCLVLMSLSLWLSYFLLCLCVLPPVWWPNVFHLCLFPQCLPLSLLCHPVFKPWALCFAPVSFVSLLLEVFQDKWKIFCLLHHLYPHRLLGHISPHSDTLTFLKILLSK